MVNRDVQIFLDGADLAAVRREWPYVQGFTTNPTLMRQAGVTDYGHFVQAMLARAEGKPVSFEVLADTLDEMDLQAHWLASHGSNVYVKIPITTTTGLSTLSLIQELSRCEIHVNVTAVMTMLQIEQAIHILSPLARSIVSIFAGRIADTGRNPLPFLKWGIRLAQGTMTDILWASPREVYNVAQARDIGCDIITLTPNLLSKLQLFGKDLTDYSLETVQMFRRDALESGLTIPSYSPIHT